MGRLEDADQDTGHGTGKVSGDLVTPDPPPTGRPPAWRSSGGDRARSIARVVGELLITFGLVTLLFVVYEIYWTDLISAGKQRDATAQLDNQWGKPDVDPDTLRRNHFEGLGEGDSFAKLYVPTFGPDYHFTIIEGTSEKVLAIGPGHYTGSAYPGGNGNFAVAGHRVGHGGPFNDIDLLNSCDAIVVETHDDWFVYRVLPHKDEVDSWATGKGLEPRCRGVAPLGDPAGPSAAYRSVYGQEIVDPSDGSVVAPVPHNLEVGNAGAQVGLLTMTTCNPRFSDRQRLIVHAVLVHQIPKGQLAPGQLPDEMKES